MEDKAQQVMAYLKKKQEEIKARKAKLKKGPKVLQLRYLSQHISPSELRSLEMGLEKIGLELSAMDTSGIPYNSISSLSAELILAITEPGISGILLSGLLTNGLYDGLKATIIKCWQLIKDKPTLTITSETATEHPAKFHLIVKNGEQTLEFQTENLSEETIGLAIDRICQSLAQLSKQRRSVLDYNPETQLWSSHQITADYLKQPQQILRKIPLEAYLEELRKKEAKA